jgi:hypothetical protein
VQRREVDERRKVELSRDGEILEEREEGGIKVD